MVCNRGIVAIASSERMHPQLKHDALSAEHPGGFTWDLSFLGMLRLIRVPSIFKAVRDHSGLHEFLGAFL